MLVSVYILQWHWRWGCIAWFILLQLRRREAHDLANRRQHSWIVKR
jgi:hypothetical protein